MKGICAAAFALSMMSIVPASLSAKGDMAKIMIKGSSLATAIEITDSKIRDFSVWAGAGVRVNGIEQTEGFIIDWSHGVIAERPNGLQHYDVLFYAKGPNSKEKLVYVVSYDYDPSTEQGYVYLPGKADEWYQLNTSAILHGHGLEGNWFRATSAWENFVRPLIAREKTAKAGLSHRPSALTPK